jgi:hypothetical protein
MSEAVPAALRAHVRERASGRCEYCLLHEDDAWSPHEPDHAIASKHRGRTESNNLVWTCFFCNRHKGSDLASIDEITGRIVRLFNPRRDRWARHFKLDGARIVPRTAIARVTEFLLKFNRSDRVRVRAELLRQGLYPR